jgi:hypothetical protein
VWLDPTKSVRPFKRITCADVFEFEPDMPHPLKKERDRAERKREFGQEWGPQIAAKISSTPFTKIEGCSRSWLSQSKRHRRH